MSFPRLFFQKVSEDGEKNVVREYDSGQRSVNAKEFSQGYSAYSTPLDSNLETMLLQLCSR
jgi:hypothetical protein